MPITDQKGLIGRLRVGGAGDDEIDQIVQRYQAALVVHRAQWQRPTALHRAHEGGKVGLDSGTVHQWWTDDDNLQLRVGGNLAQALQLLEAAFKTKPDAEIATHLGEVLWALGRRDQALNIWKESARIDASNEALQETLKRLRVKL